MTVVRKIQEILGPGMLVPMKAITFFGSEGFVLAVLPLIYWCVDRKKGARIGIVVLFSTFLNLFCKLLLKQPRPFDVDPAVGLASEETFGFPSAHSQTSVTFWGVMLTVLPRGIGIAAFLLVSFLVALSRLYLGVHFPTDILGGWILGGIVLGLYYGFGAKIEALLHRWNLRWRLIAVAALALAMNALMPTDTRLAGAFFGSAAGFALASWNLRFSVGGGLAQRGLRYLAGIAGLLAIYGLPRLVLDEATASSALVRFLRYGLVGLWASYGAPWCFLKLKLVVLESPAEADETQA